LVTLEIATQLQPDSWNDDPSRQFLESMSEA